MPLRTLTVSGTPEEQGEQVGEAFRADIQRAVGSSNAATTLAAKPGLVADVLKITEASAPGVVAELRGMATGSGVSFPELFTFNCPEIRQVHGGCSTVAIRRPDGSLLIGHNEDGGQTQTADDLALITYHSADRSVTALTYLGELAGNAVSWNSSGLIVTVNDLHPARPLTRRLSRFVVARLLVSEPAVASALALLRRVQAASGFHYLLCSVETREIVSVESTARTVSIVGVTDRYLHTNHCTHPRLRRRKGPAGPSSSRQRQDRLRALMTSIATPSVRDLHTWLSDQDGRPYSVYAQEGDVNRTLATALFDTGQRTALIYADGISDPDPRSFRL